jgi:major vault protein
MEPRGGDLVLPQGTYVLLQDGASGQVEVVTGPHKVSLADTDKPVIYERESRRFVPTESARAIRVCPAADEGQYLVLTNPSSDDDGKSHPLKGKQSTVALSMGRRINIQGPDTFALFPGQIADIVDGHQLKSNEYLLIRVYNEDEAKKNLKNAVVKTAEGEDSKGKLFDDKEIRTGNLLIIKGTDVSFYIPPTGIEVLEEKGKYTRNAVTLERLEYCILLDQNGDKRYVKGPSVVFPKPTETFIENKGKRIFRAIELNENMGIYIKVIADYTETLSEKESREFKAGEELFITGKDQKIYFPRAEHAIIKYGNETIHYATAVPAGEGRYILDKVSGDVKLVKGPKMLLPDPRTEVIVKRVLNDKTVQLWFPGNEEARQYNLKLRGELDNIEEEFLEDYSSRGFSARTKQTLYSADAAGMMADEMERKTNYTEPRSIKLDTKYDGAVLLNIWPNFAVQVVNKSGERKVVQGPKVILLEYDETLEVLELSTGKPKTDDRLIKTVYLQTKNNIVSDVITVETKDLINVNLMVSYRVDFEGDSKSWFNVSDYIKLMTQHMRSLVRNAVKKITIEDFNDNATDIVRDTILGKPLQAGTKGSTDKRGRTFDENGMKIYDVEVLNLEIGDPNISKMLITNQHDIVKQNLNIMKLEKDLQYSTKQEEIRRKELDERVKTSNKAAEVSLKEEENERKVKEAQLSNEIALDDKDLAAKETKQKTLDKIASATLAREKAKRELETQTQKERSEIAINEVEKQLAAIQPGLIEALMVNGNVHFAEVLAKNLKAQHGGLATLLSGGGGFQEILETIKGSPLEPKVKKIMEDYNSWKEGQ